MASQALKTIDSEMADLSSRQAELVANRAKEEAKSIVRKLLSTVKKNQYENHRTLNQFKGKPQEVKQAVVNLLTVKAEQNNKNAQFLVSQMHGGSFLGYGYWHGEEEKWLNRAAENGSVQAYAKIAKNYDQYDPNQVAAIFGLLAGDLSKSFGAASNSTSNHGRMARIFGQMATAEQISQLRVMAGLSPEPPQPQGLG